MVNQQNFVDPFGAPPPQLQELLQPVDEQEPPRVKGPKYYLRNIILPGSAAIGSYVLARKILIPLLPKGPLRALSALGIPATAYFMTRQGG